MVNNKKGDHLIVKNKGFKASDCFFVYHMGSHLTSPPFHLSGKEILSHLMIVSKNENIYLMSVAQGLAHECSTAAVIGKHISCNVMAPPPTPFVKGKCAGQRNVNYIFPSPTFSC